MDNSLFCHVRYVKEDKIIYMRDDFVRVIAGLARGSKLICPPGLDVRPTHDRVKEALFSMLTGRITGAVVLDAFAGSGALGIEALSRGATHATFVDTSAASLQAVKTNLEKTHLQDQAELVQRDCLSYLSQADKAFDLILLDPPYQAGFLRPALELIYQNGLLASDGRIYCEAEDFSAISVTDLFQIEREKKYGRAHVLLLKEL